MTESQHIIQADELAGTIIDKKYRIDQVIGRGGMGEVYSATHIVLGRKVAVKLLHPNFIDDSRIVSRFQQEAKIAGTIRNNHICEVTDVGTTSDGRPFLIMPLLDGCTLAQMLEKETPISVFLAVDIVDQTLSALDAAHNENIIHRDLKPDNIFISTFGDRKNFVKLLDFGISKITSRQANLELTNTGTVVGTPYYMSPEHVCGAKGLDNRTDIYALGVILYEILTRRRPYVGNSYNELIAKILTEPFLAPRRHVPTIPKKIERVILKAMSRNPAERFESAAAMQVALGDAVCDMSVSTLPLSMAVNDTTINKETVPFPAKKGVDNSFSSSLVVDSTRPKKRSRVSDGIQAIGILSGASIAFVIVLIGVIWVTMGVSHTAKEFASGTLALSNDSSRNLTANISQIPSTESIFRSIADKGKQRHDFSQIVYEASIRHSHTESRKKNTNHMNRVRSLRVAHQDETVEQSKIKDNTDKGGNNADNIIYGRHQTIIISDYD